MRRSQMMLCLLLSFAIAPAQAQIPGMKGMVPPSLSGMGAGNAAGVLGYCMKNKVLAGGDASSVFDTLSKKPGVTDSKEFEAGQSGQISTGKGSPLSLDGVQGKMKKQACDMVLKQAKTFL